MPQSADEIVAAACAAYSPRTRRFFFSHVLSPTGMVLPAEALCAEARRRGILTVIDGAHAPGMIPLRLDALPCDFYGGNCHKWMLAPSGSGFLYIGKGNEDRLQPMQVSWGWKVDRRHPDDRNEVGSTPRIYAFEFEGTRDPCAWLAVPRAIDFQADIGWEPIRARNEELAAYMRGQFATQLGWPLWSPPHPELHAFMTAFRLPEHYQAEPLRKFLWSRRIEIPVIERPYGLLLRVSTHFYNTREEIDRLCVAMREWDEVTGQ
jgi:isopenicillin-N epimerase